MGKGKQAKQSKSRSKPIESGESDKRILIPDDPTPLGQPAGGVTVDGCRNTTLPISPISLSYADYIKYRAVVDERVRSMGDTEWKDAVRWLCLNDRFYLMEKVLRATKWLSGVTERKREYVYNFVRSVERDEFGYVDLAARYHLKSLALTYAGRIQHILRNPERTIGVFSFKTSLAKSFLKQIKTELEVNDELKILFDDVLYMNPQKESLKWSENEGIVVKRQGNPKELTVEAVGLIDSQRTGMHFNELWFDDAIEKTCAGSQVFMEKAEEGIRLAIGGLGTHDKVYGGAGTRWKLFDAYENLAKSGVFKLRRTDATSDNTRSGEPRYLTQDEWEAAQREFTSYQFSCQMLNDPQADSAKCFQLSWLRFYEEMGNWRAMQRYILVDPATSKKKDSDYTAMVVMGLARDGNYYVLDIVHDRLSMFERIDKLFGLVHKWDIKGNGRVGYEKYGMMADIEAIKARQAIDMDYWDIVELGGKLAKEDRIEKLMPICEKQKLYMPKRFLYTNWEGMAVDVIDYFINWEYIPFPNGAHDDIMDAMARIVDPKLGAVFPTGTQHKAVVSKRYENYGSGSGGKGSWLSM